MEKGKKMEMREEAIRGRVRTHQGRFQPQTGQRSGRDLGDFPYRTRYGGVSELSSLAKGQRKALGNRQNGG